MLREPDVRDSFLRALIEELTPLYPGGVFKHCGSAGHCPEVHLLSLEGDAVIQIQARPAGVYVGGQRQGCCGLLPWEHPGLVTMIVDEIDRLVPTDAYITLEGLKRAPDQGERVGGLAGRCDGRR